MSELLGALARFQALWAELPEIACRGKCQTCCGPVDMSPTERELIRRQGVEIAPMTPERVAAWDANQKFDRQGHPLWCNALNLQTGNCDVYAVRPTVCRLWGVAASMPCPHGCKPTRTLDDAEAMDFLMQAMVLGGRFSEEERAEMASVLRDPVLSEAAAQLMRGDHDAADRFVQELNRRSSGKASR